MNKTILLKTTINAVDDWHIGRFSLLKRHLESLGHDVDARDRESGASDDPDFASLEHSSYDQLWLFAVDDVGAITDADAAAIQAFQRRGGGLLMTRDHQDMGASLLKLGAMGRAHHFHSTNPEKDPARHCVDDRVTDYISWPNYCTGANGDCQQIITPSPHHPLVLREDGSQIRYLPSHPHEGVVSIPDDMGGLADEIFVSTSRATGARFCSAVAFSARKNHDGTVHGRAVAQSTFHHFVDPNLDPAKPLPSFVSEPSGDGIARHPRALSDALRYIENLAAWL